MSTNPQQEGFSLLPTAAQLVGLAQDLTTCVRELKRIVRRIESTPQFHDNRQPAIQNPLATAKDITPEQILTERARLIQAWSELESEQRRLATVTRPADVNSAGVATVPGRSASHQRASPEPIDFKQQLRYLQRDCERRREG